MSERGSRPYAQGISAKIGSAASPANEAARSRRKTTPGLDHIRLRSCDRMDILTPDPTSVYLYLDKSNLLLYVGITRRGATRNREHNDTKEWWPFVARQEVEHYPNRRAAMEREKHLIHKYRPPFNKQHNAFHEEMRALYLTALGATLDTTPQAGRRLLTELRHKMPLMHVGSEGTAITLANRPEHAPLAEMVVWDRPVLILAPKKVARLVRMETVGAQTVYEFQAPRRVPPLNSPVMHLKARAGKPLRIGIHEIRAEVAA